MTKGIRFDAKRPDQYFKLMDPNTAAKSVLRAEEIIEKSDYPDSFKYSVLNAVHAAIEQREALGFSVDPTIREEVTGLVRAVAAPNDHAVHGKFATGVFQYVAGILQTNETALQSAREVTR